MCRKGKQTTEIRYLFFWSERNFCATLKWNVFPFCSQATEHENQHTNSCFPPSTTTSSTSLHLLGPPIRFVSFCISICSTKCTLTVASQGIARGKRCVNEIWHKWGTGGTHYASKFVQNGKYCQTKMQLQ